MISGGGKSTSANHFKGAMDPDLLFEKSKNLIGIIEAPNKSY